MRNKIKILTSLPLMCIACPAIAEPSHTSNSFPNDELMQEDYTYQNQANYTNMGIYEGDITANAEYDDILYQIAAGTYLAAGDTTASTCTAGNFCIGVTDATYNANSNQGLTSCATVGDTTYTQSAAGASADTDCYKACTTANVAHSATVSGNDYYGDGEDTCAATSCDSGYHVQAGLNVQNTVGTEYGSLGYINNNGNFSEYSSSDQINHGQSFYGLESSDNNAFAVYYDNNKGMLYGHGRCSTRNVTTPWYNTNDGNGNYTFASDHFVDSLTDETGEEGARYCWCSVDGYTPNGGTLQSVQSSWVFKHDNGGSSYCASGCASSCAFSLRSDDADYLAFRAAILGTIPPAGLATCEANTINITWTDASAADIAANNAGTATYDGDIRTPAAATDKTNIGKRFKGWKFSKPTPVSGD